MFWQYNLGKNVSQKYVAIIQYVRNFVKSISNKKTENKNQKADTVGNCDGLSQQSMLYYGNGVEN
jgi:hypothetical protein